MRAVAPRFIACPSDLQDARIVVYGIPFEGRVNLRKGACGGPRDLRLASDSIETSSPALGRDLEDPPLADVGDCELPDGAPPREQLDAARAEIAAWWRPGLIPFMLGGDHTATVPVMEVIAPAFPDLRVLQLDAHPDTREEFLGERYNYASAMARVMDVVPADGRRPRRGAPGRVPGRPQVKPPRGGHWGALRGGGGPPPKKPLSRHYTAPRLYEIAFDTNRKLEVDFLVHCFERYAKARVRRVLDIACGTGPHLIRLADRGYQMSGLDLSPENIDFLRQRLAAQGHRAELIVGDMTDFRLERPVDAVICMQDSQGHMLTNAQLLAHLRAVARAVKRGGLYVFDRYMASSWTDPARSWSWSKRRGRLIVRASFSALNDVDRVAQIFRERMTLEAIDNGTRRLYRQSHLSRMVFPQELKALVELAGGFEFVQWFFGFKRHQILERSKHPLIMVVVLRKT